MVVKLKTKRNYLKQNTIFLQFSFLNMHIESVFFSIVDFFLN